MATDGSVELNVDMNVSDAEKELARLHKNITKLQSDLKTKGYEKSALEKNLEAAKNEYRELSREMRKLEKLSGAEFEANPEAAKIGERMQELDKYIKNTESDIEKTGQAIESARVKLDATKETYKDIYAEAEKLRELEQARAESGQKGQENTDKDNLPGQADSMLDRFKGKAASVLSSFKSLAGKAFGAFKSASKGAFNVAKKAVSLFARGIASAAKGIWNAAKNMNVFSKLAQSIGPKLKRLGGMIRRVFVFSVITSGLRAIRSQISSYLKVNTDLQSALGSLKGAFLTAFQPIYDAILPALTALINGLTRVIAVISQFMAALFGTTAKQAQANAKALNEQAKATKAAGGAAEDAEKSLASFDEINKLSFGSGGGGGGGTSEELSAPTFDLELDDTFRTWGEAFDAFLDGILKDGIPKLKKGLNKFSKWLNKNSKKMLEMFTFPGVLDKVKEIGKELANAINDFASDVKWRTLGQAFGAGLNLAIAFLVSAIYHTNWSNIGASIAQFVNGAVSQIDWYQFGQLLWAGFKIGIETFAGFINGLNMPEIAAAASNLIKGFLDSVSDTIDRVDWARLGHQIITFFRNIDWEGISASANNLINKLFNAAHDFITEVRIGEIAARIINFIVDIDWGRVGEGASNLVIDFMGSITDGFNKVKWDDLGRQVTNLITRINWGDLAQSASNLVHSFLRGFVDFISNIDGEEVGQSIADFLTGLEWKKIITDLWDAIGGILNLTISIFWGIIKGFWDKIVTFWKEEIENKTATEIAESLSRGMRKTFSWILPDAYKDTLALAEASLHAYNEVMDVSGSSSGTMEEIGEAMGNGVINGLHMSDNEFVAWGNSVISSVKKQFGIHSPSTVFESLGEYMMAGLKLGTDGESNVVVRVFTSMLATIMELCTDAVDTMTENFVKFLKYLTTEFSREWSNTWSRVYSTAYQNIQKTISAIDALKASLASIERNIVIRITTIREEKVSGSSSGLGAISGPQARTYALPSVNLGNIPALAQGAVIPPNRSFMAVLGDQKSGVNVETPISTMKQAFKDAIQEMGLTGGSKDEAVIEVDGVTFGRLIRKYGTRESTRVGVSLVTSGA